jgi:hypothetical protein
MLTRKLRDRRQGHHLFGGSRLSSRDIAFSRRAVLDARHPVSLVGGGAHAGRLGPCPRGPRYYGHRGYSRGHCRIAGAIASTGWPRSGLTRRIGDWPRGSGSSSTKPKRATSITPNGSAGCWTSSACPPWTLDLLLNPRRSLQKLSTPNATPA